LFSAPLHGTVTVAEDGSFSYTPEAGYVGMDSFIYWVFDGELHSALAAVTIHVTEADPGEIPPPDNGQPTAGNDSYSVDSGSTLDVAADQGVLLDDSDPDGDALAAALFSAPLHGTVTLGEDGSFSYTPEAGFVGLDSFVYRAFDGELFSSLAAVTIHVNAADPGEIPPPDGCEPVDPMLAADDSLLDSLADPSLDSDAIDDVLADGGWLT